MPKLRCILLIFMPPFKTFGMSRKKLLATRRNIQKALLKKAAAKTNNSEDTSIQETDQELDSSNHEITTEPDKTNESSYLMEGRRIVQFSFVFEQLQNIGNHSSLFNCNLNSVRMTTEQRTGLDSKIHLQCDMCGKKFELKTSEEPNNQMSINDEIVGGIMSIGAGYTQLNTILSCVNIPPMSLRLYQTTHDKTCDWWKKTAMNCMLEAGKEEKEHALSIGNVNEDGIPMIPVTGDGCWSKRSYGTNYSASSGAAAIVGVHSKKVLFFGVKNKVCRICCRAESKKLEPPDHECFRNFDGPSTAMESAIITEGFKRSETDHGLIYNQYVADGDSSTYNSIRNSRPYKNVTVGKIECKNHLLRNYCKGLLAISSNTSYPLRSRKLLKENYLRIRWGVDSSVKYWTEKNIPFAQKMENIRNDIINGPFHIFGDHSKCADYFCTPEMKNGAENRVTEMMVHGVFQKIDDLAQRLASHAYSFVYDETNNLVESFNARVAKFIGGKRVNYSQRQSYAGRCAAAVISCNTGLLQSQVHTFIFGTEANPQIVRLENNRLQRIASNKNKKVKKIKKYTSQKKKDAHYGEECQKVDMDETQFELAKTSFLQKLNITNEQKDFVEKNTHLQSASPLWLETRRKLLTASWFGTVCKRRGTTNCAPLVKQILYGADLGHIPSIKHGKNYEQTALRELEKALNDDINPCGLTIDKEFSFLGASPDGKCKQGIVEIKCPSSAFGMEPDEAIKHKKVSFWKQGDKHQLVINKNHKWFFQIQGQLHITCQEYCIFAIWTGPGKMKYEAIARDDQFWKDKMESKLLSFYKNCLLPELVDPRVSRNMELRAHSSHVDIGKVLKPKN